MKKLVAYITTGFPSKEFTVDLALSLKEAGVDTIELGIPFSDPVADGPVIEEANLKTLQRGFKIKEVFEVSHKIAKDIETLWMGYFNPFYHKGLNLFIDEAKSSGVKGFIIPDLPFEEAKAYRGEIEQNSLVLIDFIAPTDPKSRIEKIAKDSKGFIYLVAYAGITGSKRSEDLTEIVSNIKEVTNTPVYVGFGVNRDSAKSKAQGVDGVIVGSAFMKVLLDDSLSGSEKIKEVSSMAKDIKSLINE